MSTEKEASSRMREFVTCLDSAVTARLAEINCVRLLDLCVVDYLVKLRATGFGRTDTRRDLVPSWSWACESVEVME